MTLYQIIFYVRRIIIGLLIALAVISLAYFEILLKIVAVVMAIVIFYSLGSFVDEILLTRKNMNKEEKDEKIS